ncbi:hypothetical protein [Hydrogenophaga sp. ANAO-22]|uniref:hypothetical protein n=1 Tax=Hydrogenophaga sp. ANAO-22 TaxID=3166645 RepID=UPI0036D310CE
MELLSKALDVKRAASWCRDLNVTEAALSNAKKKGHLSPKFAAHMAIETGADPIYWSALAVAEAEPEGPLKRQLLDRLNRQKTKL